MGELNAFSVFFLSLKPFEPMIVSDFGHVSAAHLVVQCFWAQSLLFACYLRIFRASFPIMFKLGHTKFKRVV